MTLPGKIARRGPANLLLAAEALVLLVMFRICLALIPVRRIIKAITPNQATKPADVTASDRYLEFARRVQWAVSAVARHSFVEFVCFPQTPEASACASPAPYAGNGSCCRAPAT